MRRVVRTALAEQDFRDALEYLSDRSEAAADSFTAEVADCVRLLAGQPGLGRPRAELAPGLRSTVVGRYVLFFRATDDELVVIRIVHGSRDIQPDLFEGA